MNKALSSRDILAKKFVLFEFEKEWFNAFKKPEKTGVWFLYGNSGNGKTSFLMQLVKELSKFDKVLFNSLEEGDSHTLQEAWIEHKMANCPGKVQIINEPMETLKERLIKRQSSNIIIIDSWQYTGYSFVEYLKLKKEFPTKLFIINSQTEGKKPFGKTAQKIMSDASLKIWIEGFKAFSKGRYIGPNGGIYTIWDKGAQNYWGTTE